MKFLQMVHPHCSAHPVVRAYAARVLPTSHRTVQRPKRTRDIAIEGIMPAMKTTLTTDTVRAVSGRLETANVAFAKRYPGESGARQPVHTVYGGAHIFKAEGSAKLGTVALKSLEQFAPDFVSFAKAIQLRGW